MFSNSETDWKYMVVWNKIYKTDIVKRIKFESSGTEDTVLIVNILKIRNMLN